MWSDIRKFEYKERGAILLFIAFLFYATWGTGLATDDFVHLNKALRSKLTEAWLPTAYLSVPILQYTHALLYQLIGDHLWAYNLVKAIYLSFSFLCVVRFFSIFYSTNRSILGAIIFICCPLQDGATLWFTGQYLCISLGLYLLSYAKVYKEKFGWALLLAVLASFSSYGSTPLAFGLAALLLLQRKPLGALCVAVPNIIYIGYYMWTSVLLNMGTARVPSNFSLLHYLKSYLVQIASFIDSGIGPSALLKIALSVGNISFLSSVIALCVCILIFSLLRQNTTAAIPNNYPILGTASMVLLAMGIFAVTGLYPQVTFSLGDRVMIFGCFFLATLVIQYLSIKAVYFFAACFLVAFAGLSDHWRSWGRVVQKSVTQINQNHQLRDTLKDGDTLFVSGLQYSALGSMAHIDHFASGYVIHEVFTYAWPGRPQFWLQTFSSRMNMEPASGVLQDIKFGKKFTIVDNILLYDAEKDELRRVDRSQIADELSALSIDRRHWTQLLGPGVLRDAIVWLMPSLKYAYP